VPSPDGYRYGNKETAVYELGCGLSGLMKASHPKTRYTVEDNEEYLAIAEELAANGELAYRWRTILPRDLFNSVF
jgi:phosphoenolpyruvate carboxylase